MEITSLVQGTPQWHQHRLNHWNASDAATMLGVNPHKTRLQLLHEYHTGQREQHDDFVQSRVLNRGHEFEALGRPLAEKLIGAELFQVVGVDGMLSASFDGITADGQTAWEHKQLNETLRAFEWGEFAGNALPLFYRAQLEHQCMVSGVQQILFMASEWRDGDIVDERHCWYIPDQELAERIRLGWDQFELDLDDYVPPRQTAVVVAAALASLPAVSVRLDGEVRVRSTLPAFVVALNAFVEKVPASPSTDQEFANAKAACKRLQDAEGWLDAAEAQALASIPDIEELRRTVDSARNIARTTRLRTEKLVDQREKQIRAEIIQQNQTELDAHVKELNTRFEKPWIARTAPDFQAAIKGKRTIDSLREACNVLMTDTKLALNAQAARFEVNLKATKDDRMSWLFLFPDFAQVGLKEPEDFAALAELRIRKRQDAFAEAKALKQEVSVASAVASNAPAPHAPSAPEAVPIAPTSVGRAVPAGPPTLRMGTVVDRIGFRLTETFLVQKLGVPIRERASAGLLFHEQDFDLICLQLMEYVDKVRQQYATKS